MTAKIKCRDCWYCIAVETSGWCRYFERYQPTNKEKTRCVGYESRQQVLDDMVQAGNV